MGEGVRGSSRLKGLYMSLLDLAGWEFIEPTVPAGSTLLERFSAFHNSNPRVYEELRRLALVLRARGHNRVGIAMLFEQMRWQWYERTVDVTGFKLNNDYRAYYARLLMDQEPELSGFFTTRETR